MLRIHSMPKRPSKPAKSRKPRERAVVPDWDFRALLNTDIRELEITNSLRRLGNIHVMEWDFRTILPAVKKTANQEVDLLNLLKRTARYKVLDWEIRSALQVERKPPPEQPAVPVAPCLSPADMQAIIVRLKNFLQYVVVNLIDEPNHAQIKVSEVGPKVLRFKLVLVKRDVAMLIGREGFTASAIRSILKAAAEMNGVQALLQIQSHEEEMARVATAEHV